MSGFGDSLTEERLAEIRRSLNSIQRYHDPWPSVVQELFDEVCRTRAVPAGPMIHVYIAHRLGGGPNRLDNIEAASQLMCELADRLPIVPTASWITLARYWDETKREKGLALDFAQIARCDELWLVGLELSPGMKLEAAHATTLFVPVFDLVGRSTNEIVEWWARRQHETPWKQP